MAEQISPAQRARNFQMQTRQNWQMMPEMVTYGGATNMRFELPKARFLAKILIDFKCKFTVKHASETTVPTDEFTPYKLIRSLSLDLNNGWSPYKIGGRQLALLNAIRLNPSIVFPQSSNPGGYCYLPTLVASASGAENEMRFTVELPVTVNDRDTMGIILLQANAMLATLSIDYANGNELVDYADGYDIEIKEIRCNPMLETFSVPANDMAYPDVSVLKIVNSRTEIFAGSGQNIVKLPTGTTYRKIAFYVTDDDGNPFADDDFLSNIDIVFNQADCNYSIKSATFRHLNELQLGYALPQGCYVFDFSNNGFPNYGGTRDLVDTEALTEMWLRFNSSKSGKVHVVLEQLSQLRQTA